MKVRKGFVSNSSTTSFVLVGAMIDSGKFRDILVKEYFLTEDFVKGLYDQNLKSITEDFDVVEINEIIEYINDNTELDIENGSYYADSIYVGIYPGPDGKKKGVEDTFLDRMKRTGDKIQNIEKIINECKFFTKEGKVKIIEGISWHSEAWQDG